ncbi:MAG TPA: helix-turn-helix transcriptional regulator, partial [Candidatus Faecaligallichristensenella faecipullorum]|nr:helix-turn-helix transcriptional regulator [Candidatus Faecaligallichristensenella faecipullorum]
MSDQVQQIAMRIHDLRDVSNYTVEQVAKNTGVSEEEYLSYESGAVDIPISFLLKLSQFYDIDTTTILTGEAPRLSVCAVTRKDMGVSIDRAEHYIY